LDGDQLYVGHGAKVAEIGSVVERVPVAYLDGGDANRHGVLFMDARFSSVVRAILRESTSALKDELDIAGPVASVTCAAFYPKLTSVAEFCRVARCGLSASAVC